MPGLIALSLLVEASHWALAHQGGQLSLFGNLPGFCLRALVLSMSYLQSTLEKYHAL